MLIWDWNKEIGKCKYTDGTESTIFKGNAQIIAIDLLEDNKYYLRWFSCDKSHLKNMLGLNKDFKGCIDNNRLFDIAELSLDTNYKETKTIVTEIVKSGIDIKINLYNSKYRGEE